MRLLVKNIQFNNGEDMKVNIPIWYCEDAYLSLPYLRTALFNYCDVTYDYEDMSYTKDSSKYLMTYSTEPERNEPYNVDLIDATYKPEDVTPVVCKIHHMTATMIHIDDDDLANINEGDVVQAIFEELLFKLVVHFVVDQA